MIASKSLSDRNLLSLFEVCAKLETLTLASTIKNLLRERYLTMPLTQLERIAVILRPRDPQLLRDLGDKAISEESLLRNPTLLRDMLRILSV